MQSKQTTSKSPTQAKMASFINTMFVHTSPPQPYNRSPKPLPAVYSNILAESESCIHLQSPPNAYHSHLKKQMQEFSPAHARLQHSSSGIAVPVKQESRYHEAKHGAGLGFALGWKDISKKPDLLTRSDSNARNRTQAAFQPQKRPKGTSSQQLKSFAEATLGNGSLRKIVQLPEGEDRDEWLAVNGTDELQIHKK